MSQIDSELSPHIYLFNVFFIYQCVYGTRIRKVRYQEVTRFVVGHFM